MKKLFLWLALGTAPLGLFMAGSAVADPPVVDEGATVSNITQDQIENIPTARDPFDILRQVPTVRIENTSSGSSNPRILYNTPRISYDSNICEFYGSNTFSLPRHEPYDQRLVDEAQGYLNKLSDADFLKFMDWLWGDGPEPLALRGTDLAEAMDIIDWMTDEEIDELVYQTEERDARLYDLRKYQQWRGYSGIIAVALMPSSWLYNFGPRATNIEGGMVNIPPPTFTFQGGPSDANIESIMRYITPIGGTVIEPESGNDWKIQMPYKFAYGLDRFQIRADYQYGIENNITDGSVPSIQYDPDYNTPLLNELTLAFEKALSDDMSTSITGFYKNKHALSIPVEERGMIPTIGWQLTPSSFRFLTSYKEIIPQVETPPVTTEPGTAADDTPFNWETITPRIGLSYDIGPGVRLNVPLGQYQQSGTTTTTPPSPETKERPKTAIAEGNILFKIERSVLEADQTNVVPAEQTIVKLGFPIPPMPLEGNPRVDAGASDNPVQGEVDTFGNVQLRYDLKDTLGLGLGIGYDYGGQYQPGKDENSGGDGSPETYTLDPNLIRLSLNFNDGMVQIDPPSLELTAGPEIDSVIDELQPVSGVPGFGPDSSPRLKIAENQSPLPTDRVSFNYNYFSDPAGSVGGDRPLNIGLRSDPLDSKIVYRMSPNISLGDLGDYSTRSFKVGNYTLDSLFFPQGIKPQIDTLIGQTPGIVRNDKNSYRDKQGDDPYFSSKGSWGQKYPDQWAIQRVGFSADELSAWAVAGEDLEPVIVAVIDTGIDWNHADISWDSIWKNQGEIPDNGIDDDGNGYIDDVIGWDFFYNTNLPWDEDGHGTFVAGLIAATSDNNVGISGINPAARIMVLKALDNFGHTRASYLAEAIVYAVDNGARVINLSVGGREVTFAEELAVKYAEDHGVLVFAAAGNQGQETSNYGFVPYYSVVAVGSTGIEDKRSRFSNWGKDIDITAPGEDILSLRARRTDLMLNIQGIDYEMGAAYVGDDKRYYRAAGTSFSTPIVAGVASLILSKNPGLTADEVRRMILQSARDIEVPGRDQFTGFGLLDATAALTADPDFEITADISGVEVIQDKGQVLVKVNGMVSANQFKSAVVEIGAGEDPASWTRAGDVKKPVSGGELTRIPAASFQSSKVWIIRVIVTHRNGQTREQRFTLTLG